MRRWAAILVSVSAVASYPACSSGDDAGGGPPVVPDAGDASDADARAPAPECKPRFGDDMEGCTCDAGRDRVCARGVTGGKSVCKAGTQGCLNGQWSECLGATSPQASETCFDDRDDDCNGVLDNGCMGSPDVEICGAGVPADTPFVKSSKARYAKTDTVHLFVLWNKTMTRIEAMRSDGQGCTGDPYRGEVSPGEVCSKAQWHAGHVAIPPAFFPSGSDTISLHVNPAGGPCVGQERIVTFRVEIDP